MSKINVIINGKTTEIEVKEPRGKHRKKYIQLLSKTEDDVKSSVKLFEFRNELIHELAGIDEKDIDEMEIKEIEKIMEIIEDRLTYTSSRERFLSISKQQQS